MLLINTDHRCLLILLSRGHTCIWYACVLYVHYFHTRLLKHLIHVRPYLTCLHTLHVSMGFGQDYHVHACMISVCIALNSDRDRQHPINRVVLVDLV